MFHFYWPWFALLFPLPFILKWLFPLKVKHRDREDVFEINFPDIQRLKNAFKTSEAMKKQTKRFFYVFFSFAWFFLVLALMQPEKVDQFNQIKNKGYDLLLAVDISISMQALDFSTESKTVSRLDVIKEVVGKFVLGRQGDRVGLITFGENAYLHVPLTLDTDSVSHMLNNTFPGMAGNATAIGDAIGLGVKILRDRPEGSRVLVLLTDGEDNSSRVPPLEAAKLAKKYGIKIYTIGIGKNGLVPFPNKFGGYGLTSLSIDEDVLKKIALLTGGQYFLASDQKMLESIYNQINQLEKTHSNQTIFLIREPLYFYPLSFAMACILVLSLYQLACRRWNREF
jgi:Ca-activated chloride channel homolog